MTIKTRIRLIRLGIVLLILFCVHLYVQNKILKNIKDLTTPEEYKAAKASLKEKISIPPEWRTVPEYPEELKKQLHDFTALWSNSSQLQDDNWDKNMKPLFNMVYDGEEIDQVERNNVVAHVKRFGELEDSLRKLIDTPGYSLNCLYYMGWFVGTREHDIYRNMSATLFLEANLKCDEGRYRMASKTALALLESTKYQTPVCIFTYSDSLRTIRRAAVCFSRVATKGCMNNWLLRQNLIDLNEREEQGLLEFTDRSTEMETAALMHDMIRHGAEIDLSRERTKKAWAQIIVGGMIESLEEDMDAKDKDISKTASFLANGIIKIAIKYPPVSELLAFMFFGKIEQRANLESPVQRYYDLARLNIAARILELENREIPADSSGIPEDLIPKKLTDPDSGLPYKWSDDINAYYSIGPDKADNGCAVFYDPTNGVESSGDTWIR